jgi:hypothetical protein
VERFRGASPTIDEEVLSNLAELQYCPNECEIDLKVSASSSAHGEELCSDPGAPVTATQRPSLQASVGQPVTSNATIGVALAALAAFIALVVLVVSGLKVALRRRSDEFSFWDEWRHL